MASFSPIGIFDSGVGGLSVLRHIQSYLPHENLLYLADQVHVPYGRRSRNEVQTFSAGITRFLSSQGAKLIVVACNTASAAALTYLRETFPDMPFVGMEPAVKPAAHQTRSGKVGVLATEGTFESPRYASLMARFAQDVEVFEDPCIGLVPIIEEGQFDTLQTRSLLHAILAPMLADGVDTLVLGCTHYPFVQSTIAAVIAEIDAETATSARLRPSVTIIDPAPAVARQTMRVLEKRNLLTSTNLNGSITLFTTGDSSHLQTLSQTLLQEAFDVETAVWQQNDVVIRDLASKTSPKNV